MNKLKTIIAGLFLYLCILPAIGHAQGQVTQEEWLQQMQNEEQSIQQYIDQQMQQDSITDSLKNAFLNSGFSESTDPEILAQQAEEYARQYYRDQYLAQHPGALDIFNPGRVETTPFTDTIDRKDNQQLVILCNGGNFENGIIGFNGFRTPGYYYNGHCNFIPTSNVAYNNVGFGNPDNFMLTNNAPDPMIPALRQTYNNSAHAIRINAPTPCDPLSQVNMLQKQFSSSVSGKARFHFNYALVMEDPSHQNQQANPFFVVRVLNNNGVEVGNRLCRIANIADKFFNPTLINTNCPRGIQPAVWKDWTCDMIEFDIQANKTYTIEFFMADCGQGGHFAYAYLDNLCAEVLDCCPPGPKNLKCTTTPSGSKLSWDPVPGATAYKVTFTPNDPGCCSSIFAYPAQNWIVYNTDTTINYNVAKCFSWTVSALCPRNGAYIPSLERKCSCSPSCPAPATTNCTPESNGSRVSWLAVPGATGYELTIINNDVNCCLSINNPNTTIWNVQGTDTLVPTTMTKCFGFYVRTRCKDGTLSKPSIKRCSCSPPLPKVCDTPTNFKCVPKDFGVELSWDPAASAAHYEVIINGNDPYCCKNAGPGFSNIIQTTVPYVSVPYYNHSCFSWTVKTICYNGLTSVSTHTRCTCGQSPPPSTPDSLWCDVFPGGDGMNRLNWLPVPGAASYNIEIIPEDPMCCYSSMAQSPVVINTTNTNILAWYGGCFSWRVAAVSAGGAQSPYSVSKCSCMPGTTHNARKAKNTSGSASESATEKILVTAAPNPASEYVMFTIYTPDKEAKPEITLVVYDINGRLIAQKQLPANGNLRLDVQSFATGMHVYEVKSNGKTLFRDKLIINK